MTGMCPSDATTGVSTGETDPRASALTAGLPRAGSLAGLLLMPLAVPLVIFGAAASGADPGGALKLEAAVALLTLAGAPFVTGAAIRASRT